MADQVSCAFLVAADDPLPGGRDPILRGHTHVAKEFGIGTLVGAVSAFPVYWPVFTLTALVIVVAGAASVVISYPHRSQIYGRYRPDTESQIAVVDGILMLSLNSQQLRLPVAGVTRIWRFGRLSAIEFVDTKSVVIPTDLLPHWAVPGEGPEINARWGKPIT
jgi:hypothetical protein